MSEPNITLVSLKCPDCGAELSIESGRNQAFCSYCGAKVLVANRNEHVQRIVDEAAIRKAETDKDVEIERLKNESSQRKSLNRITAGSILFLFALFVLMFILALRH